MTLGLLSQLIYFMTTSSYGVLEDPLAPLLTLHESSFS